MASASSMLRPLKAGKAGALRGRASPPGDKSVSHRALILAAQTVGMSRIGGLLEADDVLHTAETMRRLGASVVRQDDGVWVVQGVGVGGFASPEAPLDFGNSGTGCRLVMGAVATTNLTAEFTGDASLSKRPMGRVLEPLSLYGMRWQGRDGGLLPVTIRGAADPLPVDHDVKVASAQVKSALLLAALNAPGKSSVTQKVLTRDHTERMLKGFGAEIVVENLGPGGERIIVTGEAELKPVNMQVPSDPSSAAFPLVAALLVPGSDILIEGVMLNERRAGLFETLREMGADLRIVNVREDGGEKVGDLQAKFSALKGVTVPPERAAYQIDEFPILAVAAAFAEGRTTMRGLEELRVKESDRLSAIANGLKACGVKVEELKDGLVIEGMGADGVPGGGLVETHMDHRIAMSFLVMGLAAKKAVTVDDGAMIATSFPNFAALMEGLGAEISTP